MHPLVVLQQLLTRTMMKNERSFGVEGARAKLERQIPCVASALPFRLLLFSRAWERNRALPLFGVDTAIEFQITRL